ELAVRDSIGAVPPLALDRIHANVIDAALGLVFYPVGISKMPKTGERPPRAKRVVVGLLLLTTLRVPELGFQVWADEDDGTQPLRHLAENHRPMLGDASRIGHLEAQAIVHGLRGRRGGLRDLVD